MTLQNLILFLIGASFGSFLNVLYFRYQPDKFLLSGDIIKGRSYCPKCHKTLSFYELIPVISFIIQSGKCRSCKQKISFQYILIEVLSGLIFVFTPLFLKNNFITFFSKIHNIYYFWGLSFIWSIILLNLILITLIDLKFQIIPNELNLFLLFLGIILSILEFYNWNGFYSLLGPYGALLGFKNNLIINKLIALLFSLILFGGLVALTFGRGMGMGDVKLMIALGIVFGWPEIIIVSILSFILGGIISIITLILKRKTMKSLLPFGPFIVISSFLVMFFGYEILKFYFYIAEKVPLSLF
jgi:prepilin signal peptidase PulO-like enzyme (type II secretory pathway)